MQNFLKFLHKPGIEQRMENEEQPPSQKNTREKRPYTRVDSESRLRLLELVLEKNYSVMSASEATGIHYSNAKMMVRSYKTKLKKRGLGRKQIRKAAARTAPTIPSLPVPAPQPERFQLQNPNTKMCHYGRDDFLQRQSPNSPWFDFTIYSPKISFIHEENKNHKLKSNLIHDYSRTLPIPEKASVPSVYYPYTFIPQKKSK